MIVGNVEHIEELQRLRSELARLRDLIDRRPALNAGLVEAYARWTSLCYQSDMLCMDAATRGNPQ